MSAGSMADSAIGRHETGPGKRADLSSAQRLALGGSIERAVAAGEMNRRQLHRLFHRHLGIGPKLLADLERLHSSLRGVQTGYGDPLAGFSDQAHQIRIWRRRLGVTPGTYAGEVRTPMATYFSSDSNRDGPAFYL